MAELVPVDILDVIELGRQGDQRVSAWLAGFNVSAVTGARRIARNVALTFDTGCLSLNRASQRRLLFSDGATFRCTPTPNLLLDLSRLQNESFVLWHGFGRRLRSFVFAVLNATEKFLDVHVLRLSRGNAGSHRFCMSVMLSSVASPPMPVVLPVTCLCALVAREPVLDLALLLILVLILAPDKAVRASIDDVFIAKDVAIIIGDVVSILVIIAFVIAVVLLRSILRETNT
ncbi:hypothetical protein LZ32DRAFT_618316 [Colletotrichum eremochloae]|nr:hypothetical protein LZ32DRAFT_618316 [Colletotrichum eremochloae]